MTPIKTVLEELACHYHRTRAVGYTTALLNIAKSLPKCIVVAVSHRDSQLLQAMAGQTSNVIVTALTELGADKLRGSECPVFLDNDAMRRLLSQALSEIDKLERDKAAILQAVGNRDRSQLALMDENTKLRAELTRARIISARALAVMDRHAIRRGGAAGKGEHYPVIQSIMDKLRAFVAGAPAPVEIPHDYQMNDGTKWWKFETRMPSSMDDPILLMEHISGRITPYPKGGYEYDEEDLWTPLSPP